MNELKVYQQEIILTDLNIKEKTFKQCKVIAREMTNMHKIIFENENRSKQLENVIREKKGKVNNESK